MAAKNAICFDGLPMGVRAGSMSAVKCGRSYWTPTPRQPPRRARPALDVEVDATQRMSDVLRGYNRLR